MQIPFQSPWAECRRWPAARAALLFLPADSAPCSRRPMIELNPIRQRIADLQDRLASLRGYL